jgi:Thioesterase-like superfamily
MEELTEAPFFVRTGESFAPNAIAQGGWGPTLGGQVVGGLLARAIELENRDDELHPARLTVDLLRRVALRTVQVSASVVRTGRRMKAVDAVLIQDDEIVARGSALFLRPSELADADVWTTPITMPPVPAVPERWPEGVPMFIRAYGRNPHLPGDGFQWQHHGPKFAWVCEIRPLVEGEGITPFVRAAMAVDVTPSLTNFGPAGLKYINADYTLTLSRLPDGPFIGLAAIIHHSHAGVATGTASLFDSRGPIGTGTSTAIANPNFLASRANGSTAS